MRLPRRLRARRSNHIIARITYLRCRHRLKPGRTAKPLASGIGLYQWGWRNDTFLKFRTL
jgi:hypothetical protein